MDKKTRQLVSDNNCTNLFKDVNKFAKDKFGYHLAVYLDYDAEYSGWEFFSIEARDEYDEPEIWVADSCLYDGLITMMDRLKELTK